jgi:GNAT superfamily N-acetyltransferase
LKNCGSAIATGLTLKEIAPEDYAREVLPHTFPLWAGRRSMDTYVAQTSEIARGAYGRRFYRTLGLYDGKTLLASCKRYERRLYNGSAIAKAIGFGAVYTAPPLRGRGYASVLLATELDRARNAGCAIAYLFSDIRPEFYMQLGFTAFPSRDFTLHAGALPSQRVTPAPLRDADWEGVKRCFENSEAARSAGFARDRAAWSWIRMRMRHGSEHEAGHMYNLVARRGRAISAYVLGARAPERDAYVLDEFGFLDDVAAATVPALVRAAAGDLRRITGWVPPSAFRLVLPRAPARKRERSIFMMAALSSEGRDLLQTVAARERGNFGWVTEHI